MIFYFIISIGTLLGYIYYRYYAITTQAVQRETIKSVLLKVSQIVALISGFGLLGGKLDVVVDILNYLNLNLDQTWDYVQAIITVVIGLGAFFKTEVTAAELRAQTQGIKAQAAEGKSIYL